MANKAYKYRLYPTREQMRMIMNTIGCCRYVYNMSLEKRESAYRQGRPVPGYTALCRDIASLKKDPAHAWLKDADSAALQQSVRHLMSAYDGFFAGRSRRPKFKSKRKSRWSYHTPCVNGNIRVGDGCVVLPKLGRVRAAISRTAPVGWELKSATVSVERDGTVYVSVLYAYERDIPRRGLSESTAVGLDYKSDGLYVSSDGDACGSPKFFRKSQERLAKAQRKLRHMKKGSANREKQLRRIAKIHRHTANQRRDFLHKESALRAKAHDIVCVEGLDMKALSNGGFGNGKAAMDNGWGMFLSMLEYKLRDRDVNAARNILREGLRVYRQTAAA